MMPSTLARERVLGRKHLKIFSHRFDKYLKLFVGLGTTTMVAVSISYQTINELHAMGLIAPHGNAGVEQLHDESR